MYRLIFNYPVWLILTAINMLTGLVRVRDFVNARIWHGGSLVAFVNWSYWVIFMYFLFQGTTFVNIGPQGLTGSFWNRSKDDWGKVILSAR